MNLTALIAALDPMQKAAFIAFGALTLVPTLSKLASELRVNHTSHRKQESDLINDLVDPAVENGSAHPLAIQARFHAATGCHPTRVPPADEIIAFVQNRALADLYNIVEYAHGAEFVAYGTCEKTFVPRGEHTLEELKKQDRAEFRKYLISAGAICFLIGLEKFGTIRYLPVSWLFLYALLKVSLSVKISRTLRFLDRFEKASTQAPRGDATAEKEKGSAAAPASNPA